MGRSISGLPAVETILKGKKGLKAIKSEEVSNKDRRLNSMQFGHRKCAGGRKIFETTIFPEFPI